MSHHSAISQVGDKLIVGLVDTAFVSGSTGAKLFPGTSVLNGPVYIGFPPASGSPIPTANCMIGPPVPGTSFPASLEVSGISNILGTLNVAAISNFTGISNFTAVVTMSSLEVKNGIDIKNALNLGNATTCSNAPVVVNGPLTVQGPITSDWLEARLKIAESLPAKSFDIPHPTKPNTHRLRYVCLEGPEVGTYVRGRLIDSDTIELPYYWKNLVDPESISVNLTPVGFYQELYVDKIEWGTRIKIKNSSGTSINCYYTVFAERKTKDKLQPEYEGKSPDDYPGNNEEYSISGWNYDRRMKK